MCASWFAESDPVLRRHVAACWARRAAADAEVVPHECVAADVTGDVWDLVRDGGQELLQRIQTLPDDALLLVVAGPPCLQLSFAGGRGGRVGVCGRDSVHAFAVPLVAQAAAGSRPDVCVHAALENSGSFEARPCVPWLGPRLARQRPMPHV